VNEYIFIQNLSLHPKTFYITRITYTINTKINTHFHKTNKEKSTIFIVLFGSPKHWKSYLNETIEHPSLKFYLTPLDIDIYALREI
jgi:hypothetical protein